MGAIAPRVLLLALPAIASSAAAASPDGALPLEGRPARYVVFELAADGRPRPLSHQAVVMRALRPSRTAAEVAAGLRDIPADVQRVGIVLWDAAGAVVYRDVAEVPLWLRSEFGAHGEEGPETLLPAPKVFVVRVPSVPASRLELEVAEGPGGTGSPRRREHFDLDALAGDESLPLARFSPGSRLLAPPPPSPANRVDLLLMGDGYTAAEAGKFATDASSLAASFFLIPPYSTYGNFVTTATLFTASAQAGADHPPYNASCVPTTPPTCCADPLMQSDPRQGTFVTTAFDASYCTANIHRLLTVDTAKVLAAAGAYPDWDKILVLVNDATYGGAGGSVPVVSTHSAAVPIAQHEYGHSFTRLADEYTSPFPGYPACSDVTSPPCEPNVTDQTSRSLIKWAPWILASTPVPTPDTPAFDGLVGLFEGARYRTTGMYRPQRSCAMRTLAVPFCRVCSQTYVLRLYQGGWGVPASGIDSIEPGSESPPPGAVTAPFPGSLDFQVSLVGPAGGPALGVTWLVDGTPVAGATSSSFTFTPGSAGTYQIDLQTRDLTPLVHPAMAGTALDSGRSWTVTVLPGADLEVTVSPSAAVAVPGQPFTYAITVRNHGPNPVTGASVTDTFPAALTGVTWTCSASPGSSCAPNGSGSLSDSVDLLSGGTAAYTATGTVDPAATRQIVNVATVSPPAGGADPDLANNSVTTSTPVFKDLAFYTLTPCRLVDTRGSAGPLGGPALVAGLDRVFTLAGACGVPATAWAVSVNLAVTGPTTAGNLRLYPAGTPLPTASSINYAAGQTRGNNAIVPLGASADIAVRCAQASGTTHFILDVNGYFE